ncbi:hypothetical protein F4778DRAFT_780286 [Xylariomycetidae sp. FL2044]|nr:hypothetical protein F4778DRAFT_780286 [Xylariomycetidae sp. FL2044]
MPLAHPSVHPMARPQAATATAAAAANVVKANPVAARALPLLAVSLAVYGVGSYVHRQLSRERSAFDKIFAQQNTPEVEAARRRQLDVEHFGDPRNNLLNFLGWSSSTTSSSSSSS